jgi:hypothetical protein
MSATLERVRRNEASQAGAARPYVPYTASDTASSGADVVLALRGFFREGAFRSMASCFTITEVAPTANLVILCSDASASTFSLGAPAAPGVLRLRLVAGAGREAQDEDTADFSPTLAEPILLD